MTYTIVVLGLDPGGTTGWAKVTITAKDKSSTWSSGTPFWDAGEIDHPNHYLALDSLISTKLRPARQDSELHLLCEGFDNRANPAAELVSLEYIGVVKRWAQMHPHVKAQYPSPSRKEWASDKKLKALGLYESTKGGHLNDARRHVVRYLCTEKHFYPMLEQLRVGLHEAI
jgi:hypothetical protein